MLYSIDYINLITERSDAYQIDGLNYICSTMLGGTGGHSYDIDALNEICTLQGVTAGHKYNIDALNAICSGSYKYEDEAWSYIQSSSVLNQIPLKTDALIWLDGTISGENAVDKISGKLFPITNRDFIKGFPLKSVATISAPVGDAALIAADINGFWYTAGTPNQIPISSLSSDIDYAHRLFCKRIDAVLSGDIETIESRISDVVLYANVKADTDLTECQEYFNTVIEDAVSHYIWWNGGNSTTGTGLKAAPWKSINKVTSSGTPGRTVYMMAGNHNEFSDLNALKLTVGFNFKSVSLTSIIPYSSTLYDVVILSGNQSFKNLIFSGQNTVDSLLKLNYSYPATLSFLNCFFQNVKKYHIEGNTVHENITIKDSVFVGDVRANKAIQTVRGGISLIDSSYFLNALIELSLIDSVVKNTKLNTDKDSAVILYGIGLSYFGNSLTYKVGGITKSAAYSSEKTIEINNNSFNLSNQAGTIAPAIDLSGTIILTVKENIFNSSDASYANAGYYVKTSAASQEIDNNIMISKSTTALYHFAGSGVGMKIRNNYSKSNSLIDMQIALGGEDGVASGNENSIITGLRIIGFKNELPATINASTHSLFVNSGINIKTAYNYISETCIGLVIKTGTQQSYTSEGVYGNILIDCTKSIWARGVGALNIFNNTVVHTENEYGQEFDSCILLDENSAVSGDQFCENVLIKNSIIVSLRNAGLLQNWDAHAGANGCTADYNIYYSSVAKPFKIGATTYSFAEWQALGHDAHSIMLTSAAQAKALFADFDNGDFSLVVGSAAIGAGATLAGYTTLLDSASTWGSETTTPIIVTKENESLCVGAYTR